VGHAQLRSGGTLKGGYRLAQNELLLLKDGIERSQQLMVEGLVLALEVEHGDRLGGSGGRRRRGGAWHVAILAITKRYLPRFSKREASLTKLRIASSLNACLAVGRRSFWAF
jgi:hypothetical protein